MSRKALRKGGLHISTRLSQPVIDVVTAYRPYFKSREETVEALIISGGSYLSSVFTLTGLSEPINVNILQGGRSEYDSEIAFHAEKLLAYAIFCGLSNNDKSRLVKILNR